MEEQNDIAIAAAAKTEAETAFHRPPNFPADYYIHDEKNDFIDEAIVLLNSIYHNSPADVEDVVMYTLDDEMTKHTVLLNWIALSLVRRAEHDVATVAVYQNKGGITVYWTKNFIDGEDEQHAEEFGNLIRDAAKQKVSLRDFQAAYFNFMAKNCKPKLSRRVSDFIAVANKKERFTSANWPTSDVVDIEQLDGILASAISMPSWYSQSGTKLNRADFEALKLGGFDPHTSGPLQVFTVMRNILTSIRKEATEAKKAFDGNTYATLSAHAWMLGESNMMEQMVKYFQHGNATLNAVAKIGEYFRGTGRLYNAMSARGFSEPFRSFQLIMIHPASPHQVELHEDWFHVIETIYYRQTGRVPDISRGRFFAKYASAVQAYRSWSKSFERHCEVSLIEALIEKNLPPVEIGVSKLCCDTCTRWIQGLNDFFYNRCWYTAGCHGKLFLRAHKSNPSTHISLAEAAVKEWLYRKIVDIVDPLIPCPGESSGNPEWERDENGPGGYNYPLVTEFTYRTNLLSP